VRHLTVTCWPCTTLTHPSYTNHTSEHPTRSKYVSIVIISSNSRLREMEYALERTSRALVMIELMEIGEWHISLK
jgi:hypothetical protein